MRVVNLDTLPHSLAPTGNTVEDQMKGGQRYGGYIVRKFPENEFLGKEVEKDEKNGLEEISRNGGSLMTQSKKFGEEFSPRKSFNIIFG